MNSTHKNQSFAVRLSFEPRGLAHARRAERSVRTQLIILAGVVAVLAYLRPPAVWWALASV